MFTGYTCDGGFATHVLADARYCYSLAGLAMDDASAAPLLCAGLIGWRALKAAGEAPVLGLYGFGAAAHLIAQVAHRAGPHGVRIHAPRRRRRAGPRARARLRLGRRLRRAAAVAAGRRDPVRAGGLR